MTDENRLRPDAPSHLLEVICENCPRRAVLNNRFLSRNYGAMQVVNELRFVCSLCRSQRFRLKLVPDHLGEKEPLRMQWFRGVYEGSED